MRRTLHRRPRYQQKATPVFPLCSCTVQQLKVPVAFPVVSRELTLPSSFLEKEHVGEIVARLSGTNTILALF